MLPRLVIGLAPLLIALTFGFALYHAYLAAVMARAANWPFALFYLVLGIGGLALSLALLRAYRGVRARVRGQAGR